MIFPSKKGPPLAKHKLKKLSVLFNECPNQIFLLISSSNLIYMSQYNGLHLDVTKMSLREHMTIDIDISYFNCKLQK